MHDDTRKIAENIGVKALKFDYQIKNMHETLQKRVLIIQLMCVE